MIFLLRAFLFSMACMFFGCTDGKMALKRHSLSDDTLIQANENVRTGGETCSSLETALGPGNSPTHDVGIKLADTEKLLSWKAPMGVLYVVMDSSGIAVRSSYVSYYK